MSLVSSTFLFYVWLLFISHGVFHFPYSKPSLAVGNMVVFICRSSEISDPSLSVRCIQCTDNSKLVCGFKLLCLASPVWIFNSPVIQRFTCCMLTVLLCAIFHPLSSVLYCTAVLCSVPFRSVPFRSVLFCSVLFCSVLVWSSLVFSVLFCSVFFVLFFLFCTVFYKHLLII